MSRVVNAVFSMLVAVVLLGPILIFACEKADVDLPSWMTAEDARYLSGGITDGNVKGNATLHGIRTGLFQDAISNEINNRIPFKATVMLSNAALQRSCIAAANTPFTFGCYPTYYGSSRVYIPSVDAVGYIAKKRSAEQLDTLSELGECAAEFAMRHPDISLSILVVPAYRDPAASPTYSLVADCMTPAEQCMAILAGAGDAPNLHVLSVSYDSFADYYDDFFRTDHHWSYKGCVRAYNMLANVLGLAPFSSPGERQFEGYLYSGATARWSLDLVQEAVADTSYDFAALSVVAPDGSVSHYDHEAFLGRNDPGKRYGFYDSYYDSIPSGSTIIGPGAGRAVLVSNSFGAGITPYLAMNYESLFATRNIHPSGRDASARLEAIVNEQGAESVFIVADPTDLAGFQGVCPEFFGEAPMR